MTDPQADVPFAIARSAVANFLLYAVPVAGILVVLPVQQVTSFGGFVDAIQRVFTVYGGGVAGDGSVSLSGAGTVLGDVAALLPIVCLITSGVTWIMGSLRELFGAVLGVTISTTLVSYLLIFPALCKLRRSHADTPRPFRMPAHRALTVLLIALLAVPVVQIFAPGLGVSWFGPDFAPDGWGRGERWTYLATELAPVLFFVAVGVLFHAACTPTRRAAAAASRR